ncbi:MAG: hypothetical protein ACUZ8E_12305 [Candidatus Anammoxibacter sp.]
MNNHKKLLSVMQAAFKNNKIEVVHASGDFTLVKDQKMVLFPGSVYGFAVSLNKNEKQELFNEASKKGLAQLNTASDLKPIKGNLYPLYWGKDKQIGARPYQHLRNPKGTGAIRLSTYNALIGKEISCAVVVVSNCEAEKVLQKTYPCLLKTTTQKQKEIYRDRNAPHRASLPHHRTYGSVYGGSADQAESDPWEHKPK